VYKGRYLGCEIALKQMELSYEDFIKDIRKEVELSAMLSHHASFTHLYGIYLYP